MNKLGSRKKIIVFSLVPLIALSILGEAYFRIFHLDTKREAKEYRDIFKNGLPHLFVWHPFYGFMPRPGWTDGVVAINTEGYRGRILQKPKPAGTIRLLAIGGSTTMMQNLYEKDTYPEILRNMTEEYIGSQKVDVLNGGCGAYTTTNTLIRFELDYIDYKPDYVFIMDGINDLRANWRQNFKSDYSHINTYPFQFYEETPVGKLMSKLMYSCSYSVMCFEEIQFRKLWVGSKDMPPLTGKPVYYSVETFRRNLKSIISIAKANNATPILATMALSFPRDNPPPLSSINEYYRPPNSAAELYDGMDMQNEAMRELSIETNVPLVDLAKSIPPSKKYFTDECHYNAEGAKLVAVEFFKALKALLPAK